MITMIMLLLAIGPLPVQETVIENQFRLTKLSWPISNSYRMATGTISVFGYLDDWSKTEVKTTLDLRNCYNPIIKGDTNSVIWGTGGLTTIDFTGSRYVHLLDMTVRADNGGAAAVFARDASGASSGFHVIKGVLFEGQVIIEGSECTLFESCNFTSKDTRPAVIIRNGTYKRLGYTMQQLTFRDCQFTNFNGGPAVRLTSTATMTDINFIGGGFSCGGDSTTTNDAAMVVDTGPAADHQLKQLHISNMRWETSDRKVSIQVIGVNSIIGLAIRDSTFHQKEALVRGTRLDYAVIDNVDTSPGDPAYEGPALDCVAPDSRVNLSNSVKYKR